MDFFQVPWQEYGLSIMARRTPALRNAVMVPTSPNVASKLKKLGTSTAIPYIIKNMRTIEADMRTATSAAWGR